MAIAPQYTSFTLDTMGRFLCNTLDEAMASTQVSVGGRTRDFDVIIVGGGTFGSVMAATLADRDSTRSRRILVLEGGPFVLPEHNQNLPFGNATPNFFKPWVNDPNQELDLQYPGLLFGVGGRSLAWGGWSPEPLHNATENELTEWPATTVADLQSTYFSEAGNLIGATATNDFIYGPLHEALRAQLAAALKASPPAGLVLGTLDDHPIVRDYKAINGAMPPDGQLKDWLALDPATTITTADLLTLLKLEAPLAVQATGLPGFFPFNKFSGVPLLTEAARQAATDADGVGQQADARKRVMVVPSTHVLELVTQTQPDNWVRVVGVNVVDATGNVRYIPLAQPPGAQGVVVIALGTIESTRLALLTFKDSLTWRAALRMGENHIAHLRSNLTIRVPTTSVPGLAAAISRWTAFRGGHTSTEVSALLVKGKQNIGGQDHYFHFQITASGGSPQAWNSEAQLFRKVPDMEQVASMLQAKEDSIVITIRGIGEMSPHNPDGRVGLATTTGDVDSNGRAKAFANLGDARAPARPGESSQTTDDRAVWAAMDDFADQIALIFAAGQPFEILAGATWGQAYPDRVIPLQAAATQADVLAARQKLVDRVHDPLGTTHHEAGTLRMSDDPAKGVTNAYGRIHDTTNCYAVGPALFPRSGSPNPMLTSVALAHRTAQMLTDNVLWKPDPWVAPTAAGFKVLFDGTSKTFGRWVRVSPGRANGFALVNGEIVTYGGSDFGLLYHPDPVDDFTLHVEFKVFDPVNQNSGVFVRFRDPLDELPAALAAEIQAKANDFNLNLPTDAQLYASNRAWSAVHSGFEVQIDDTARGDPRRAFQGMPEPDGVLNKNRTGAIYKIPAGDSFGGATDPTEQQYTAAPNLVLGRWYRYEISAKGNVFKVVLVDTQTGSSTTTSMFTNANPIRGLGNEAGTPIGHIGLQSYPNSVVAFRRIEIGPPPP